LLTSARASGSDEAGLDRPGADPLHRADRQRRGPVGQGQDDAGTDATVQELRDLASGLQPAALAGGGLRAATEDLASRIPVRMRLDVVDARFEPRLESAAWFVVAEGVANVVKHAQVGEVAISAFANSGSLHVVVSDDGVGGVDRRGSGLQGLADRVAALGGRLSVGPGPGGGTRLEAVLPCG